MSRFVLSSRSRVVRPVAALVLAAVVATVAACGSDNNNGTGPMDVSGTYSLTTVDGSALPYAVPNNPEHDIVITSATGTLGSDHTYTIVGTGTSDGGDPQQVVADAGTYTVSGSTITFSSSTFSGASYTAAATSSTITATVPGAFAGSTNTSFTLVFEKAS